MVGKVFCKVFFSLLLIFFFCLPSSFGDVITKSWQEGKDGTWWSEAWWSPNDWPPPNNDGKNEYDVFIEGRNSRAVLDYDITINSLYLGPESILTGFRGFQLTTVASGGFVNDGFLLPIYNTIEARNGSLTNNNVIEGTGSILGSAINKGSIINNGTIRADKGSLSLSDTITNNHILTASTQGQLKLTGTVTNSANGIIQAEGGDPDMSGSVLFSNCTVQGGQLVTDSADYPGSFGTEAGTSNTFNGITVGPNVRLNIQSNSSGRFIGTVTNQGAIRAEGNLVMGANEGMLDNAGTLEAAGGTITLASVKQLNMQGTLSGGTWVVRSNSSIDIYESGIVAAQIKINEANIQLDGSGSNFQNVNFLENNQGKGRFTITNGRNFTTLGKLANSGTIEIGPQSTLTVKGAYTQTGGITLLNEGTLAATEVVLNGGVLSGNGLIDADVYNDAEISPGFSPGLLQFLKNFTQTSKGKIIIEIGGTNPSLFDQFKVKGQATLGGTLEVRFTNGFKPKMGDVFPIFTFGNRTLDFENFIGLYVDDLFLKPVFQDNGFQFECVHTPEPATLALLIIGGLALLRRRR